MADPPAPGAARGPWLERWARAAGLALPRRIARRIALSADLARDAGRHSGAAVLYEEAYRLAPRRHDLLVQSAHMHKEAGDLERAWERYRAALALMPDDADLALQIGHYHRVAGRARDAAASYARAAALRPGWTEPELQRATLRGFGEEITSAAAVGGAALVPELLPDPPAATVRPVAGVIEVRRLGARVRHTAWGVRRTLAGVEAIRGCCLTDVAAADIDILLDGVLVHREPAVASSATQADGGAGKLVFNAWVDFGGTAPGVHAIELRLQAGDRSIATHLERIVVVAPIPEAKAPASDAIVTPEPHDGRPLEAQIRARRSMIRPAARGLFDVPVAAVLVQRVDQLGDLIVSVPAIRRLRALFPDARLIGLLSAANATLGAALGLFDGIVVAAFAEDPRSRRRVMPAEEQRALAAKLAPFAFDLAVDLSPDPASRPILLLSGARFLHGFDTDAFPWLISHATGQVRDAGNMHEAGAHAGKLLALVEWLGAVAQPHHHIVPRVSADDGPRLARYGLAPGEPYAVIHCGARLAFSRWPSFPVLAARIVAHTPLRVLLLGAEAPPGDASSDRLRYCAGELPFEDFDALLANATMFIGNDSGPKHLAAMRGTKVISVHMARVNWSEWGQEGAGFIVSRRVPCAGCSIHYAPEECGKGFACIADISVDDVMSAVVACLAE